ncbi:NTP transferase domain-containing protein [Thalassotalea euphylliae]|uniref:nucleotidyltransferase family protein n=1 Tax=Thalassotalea euphylliae TaxID=1655234 RepID=UPI003626BB40
MTDCSVILLAAGNSSRLGQRKQLVHLQGQSLVRRQTKLALSFSPHVTLVVGCESDTIKEHIADLPVTIVKNNDWQQGMGSSIATGVAHIKDKGFNAVMLLLVDLWRLELADLQGLYQAYQHSQRTITNSTWKQGGHDVCGPPVVFSSKYFDELTRLNGEQGAKPILTNYKNKLTHYVMGNARYDLDTPEQLAEMVQYSNQTGL